MTNNVFLDEKVKKTTTKRKHKNPRQSRESNTGPLAIQSNAMNFWTTESTGHID